MSDLIRPMPLMLALLFAGDAGQAQASKEEAKGDYWSIIAPVIEENMAVNAKLPEKKVDPRPLYGFS